MNSSHGGMKIRYTGSMRCPLGDGELTSHTTQGENGLLISFSTCPVCRGYWMESFAANFIQPTSIDRSKTLMTAVATYDCPICTTRLTRSTGDNIPEDVFVYDCPRHHGYFFPTGQLAVFKKAQQTKIAYHKLWHVPMLNVSSILLASFILILVAGVTIVGLRQKTNTQSQAQQILTHQSAYSAASSVFITATTSSNTSVALSLPTLDTVSRPMQTNDNHVHRILIQNLLPGTYRYFFTITAADHTIQSDTFTFTVHP